MDEEIGKIFVGVVVISLILSLAAISATAFFLSKMFPEGESQSNNILTPNETASTSSERKAKVVSFTLSPARSSSIYSTTSTTHSSTTTSPLSYPSQSTSFSPQNVKVGVEGNPKRVDVYEDSVGFTINVSNRGRVIEMVEVRVFTSQGEELNVRPSLFNLNPGSAQPVFIRLRGAKLPWEGYLKVVVKSKHGANVTTIPIIRHAEKYTKVKDSGKGEGGCGLFALH